MTTYTLIKTLHILSMALLFGTGLGTAFSKWMADRSGDVAHIAVTNRHVVLADWCFTTPAVILQPLTGLWMVHLLHLPIMTPWIAATLLLFFFAGACWLPVVWLQIRMQKISADAVAAGTALPALYWRMARQWFWLGAPAFTAVVLIVALMVAKHVPGVGS